MIDFIGVRKQYGPRILLRNASFRVGLGDRLGIVGPNGAGKSTLFGMINGSVSVDGGSIQMPNGLRIGHLRQTLEGEGDETLLDFALRADPRIERLHEEIHRLETTLPADPAERANRLARIGTLQTEYEHLGGYKLQSKVEAGLSGLGFPTSDFDRPFRSFSGGWRMRAELARVLAGDPELLLLDEPSNYLDLPAVEWLKRQLDVFQGTLMLISHDRYLLRTLARAILEVSGGETTRYSAGYDEYLEERAARFEQRMAAWRSQERKRDQMQRFIDRFRAKSSLATRVQSRVKLLDKLERLPEPEEEAAMTLVRIPEPPHSGTETLRLEGLTFGYNPEKPLIRSLDLRITRGEKIAVVGYNGMGKTTLVRLMAGALEAQTGRRIVGHQVVIGYQSQEFAETLPPEKRAYDVVRAAAGGRMIDRDVRTLLGSFGFGGEAADKPVHVLSGGEKIRLAFARIFANPPNFLLLDEPTTHLDLDAREALENAIEEFTGTVVLVSHDVTFTRNVAKSVLEVGPKGVRFFPGGYDYYLEKTSAEKSAPPASVGDSSAVPDGRERNRQRNELKKQTRQLERAVADAEKRIQEIESEQQQLAERLATVTGRDAADIGTRLAALHDELEQTMAKWEEDGRRLEEARAP
jgi:ATP-binding cassette subfamily F protein 3